VECGRQEEAAGYAAAVMISFGSENHKEGSVDSFLWPSKTSLRYLRFATQYS
jgi:hypothetical protein